MSDPRQQNSYWLEDDVCLEAGNLLIFFPLCFIITRPFRLPEFKIQTETSCRMMFGNNLENTKENLQLRNSAIQHPLHYWLRPIESVRFRFDNLGSHFIRVQIFQIDFLLTPSILSASKYFRYSCRGQNELFLVSLSVIILQ